MVTMHWVVLWLCLSVAFLFGFCVAAMFTINGGKENGIR